MRGTAYYQRNREVVLNRANKYHKNNKEVLRKKQKRNIENYLKKKNIQRENMEETDIIICLKKISQG